MNSQEHTAICAVACTGSVFSPELLEQMRSCKRTWGMGFLVISDVLLEPHLRALQRETIRRFCELSAEDKAIEEGFKKLDAVIESFTADQARKRELREP